MPIHVITFLVAAGLVVWIYHRDHHEKEPPYAIALALVVGFAGMWLIGILDQWALDRFAFSRTEILQKAAVISVIEETGKLLAILALAWGFLRREFNDPMDGLVYGRLVGLGMAAQESLLYLSLAPPTAMTLGMEVIRLCAHSLLAGIVGFAVGFGAAPNQKRRPYPSLVVLGLALSITLHFAWNTVAYAGVQTTSARVTPMVLMLVMMGIWRLLWNIAERKSRWLFLVEKRPVPTLS